MLITAPFVPIFMVIIGMKTQKKAENQMEKMAAFSAIFSIFYKVLQRLSYLVERDSKKKPLKKVALISAMLLWKYSKSPFYLRLH